MKPPLAKGPTQPVVLDMFAPHMRLMAWSFAVLSVLMVAGLVTRWAEFAGIEAMGVVLCIGVSLVNLVVSETKPKYTHDAAHLRRIPFAIVVAARNDGTVIPFDDVTDYAGSVVWWQSVRRPATGLCVLAAMFAAAIWTRGFYF